eukprot:3234238-Rhodomonas_salina.1
MTKAACRCSETARLFISSGEIFGPRLWNAAASAQNEAHLLPHSLAAFCVDAGTGFGLSVSSSASKIESRFGECLWFRVWGLGSGESGPGKRHRPWSLFLRGTWNASVISGFVDRQSRDQ